MEKFFSRLKRYCDDFHLEYKLVDIDGKVLYTNYGDDTTINIPAVLRDPTLTVFPIQSSNFINGYVITASQLSHLEKVLLGNFAGTLATLHAFEHGGVTRYNSLNFWRDVLHRQIEEDELLSYSDQNHINLNNLFLILFIKISPAPELQVNDINYIQDLIKGYCVVCKKIYYTLLHPGELILIIEIPRERASDFKKIKEDSNYRMISDDVIHRLQKLNTFEGKSIIMGVSEIITEFRDISRTFSNLKNLMLTAAKLDERSRVILYDHLPLYSLLQNISKIDAQKYVDTVFKNIHPFSKNLLVTIETLYRNNLNISQAAHKLGLHRNTLEYRLHKIHSQTHLNPLDMYDAVQLILALQLKKLYNV